METCQMNCGNTFLVKFSVVSAHCRLSPCNTPTCPNLDVQIALSDESEMIAFVLSNNPKLSAAETMLLTRLAVLINIHAANKPTGIIHQPTSRILLPVVALRRSGRSRLTWVTKRSFDVNSGSGTSCNSADNPCNDSNSAWQASQSARWSST